MMKPFNENGRVDRALLVAVVAAMVAGIAAYFLKELIGTKVLWGNASYDVQHALGLKAALTVAVLIFLFVYQKGRKS